MIGKVASSGNGFGGIYRYLINGSRDKPNPDRVAWTETRNLLLSDPAYAPRLMRAVANQSVRVQKPAYHLVLSFHKDENPSDELMRQCGDLTLEDLELNEHQVVFVAHNDTEHRHLHLMINRVHPGTGKAWHTGKDFARLERSVAKQAKAFDLMFVPGRHNSPELFTDKPIRVRNSEFRMHERVGGDKPKDRWSFEEIKSRRLQLNPIFEGAMSWDQLTALLKQEGLAVSRKGQGIIISDTFGYMKLSDLGKQVRLGGLEDRYGETFHAFSLRKVDNADGAPPVLPQNDPQTSSKEISKLGHMPSETGARPALQSSPEDESGGLADDDKDQLRKRIRAERALGQRRDRKPATTSSDDTTPAGSLRPDIQDDPRQRAYRSLREARAQLQMARGLYGDGKGNKEQLKAAYAELEHARRELELHLTDDERLEAEERRRQQQSPERAAPPPPPQPPAPPVTKPVEQKPVPKAQPADHSKPKENPRGEAFGSLSDARNALDMARAMYKSGLIDRDQLDKVQADVRAAEEKLRPHLSLGETLDADIRDALGKRGRPSRPPEPPPRDPDPPRPKKKKRDRGR